MSLRNENAGGADLPPEYCQYNDDGCEFGGSCLNCHLPICIYDEPGGKQRFLKRKRALEMARLFSNEGKSVKELAGIFDVSTRTVQRALKAVLDERKRKGTEREKEAQDIASPPLEKSRFTPLIRDSVEIGRGIRGILNPSR